MEHPVNLRYDRRVLRPPRLEELRDARQTAGDVLRLADLARGLGNHVPGLDGLLFFDQHVGADRQTVNSQQLALLRLNDDLRVVVALVLDDDALTNRVLARIREHAMRTKLEATADELWGFLLESALPLAPNNVRIAS